MRGGGERLVGRSEGPEHTRLQQRLRAMLYRLDCPSPLTIGEYALDLLAAPERTVLARHVLECDLCADELQTARAFLIAAPAAPAPEPWHALKRVVATLFTPGMREAEVTAYGMVRGGASAAGAEYRAGPVRIVIGTVPGTRRGSVSLDGLMLHSVAPAEALADREVTMSSPAQTHVTRTDDLGSFAFEDVAAGSYALEVKLADEIIVIETITVSG